MGIVEKDKGDGERADGQFCLWVIKDIELFVRDKEEDRKQCGKRNKVDSQRQENPRDTMHQKQRQKARKRYH
jgi:hypothetical protein